tara:strand:+ start:2745 stop:2999 length:255 start_codon:yes stop_codon:yes gene_type:complete
MKLVGKNKLQNLLSSEVDQRKWLISWISEVEYASWKSTDDVLQQFPNASITEGGRVTFPTSNKNIKIHVKVAFPQCIVVVVEVA